MENQITQQEIWKLRLKHSISTLEIIQVVKDLMQRGLSKTEAIQAAVEAIKIGDFQTLGEAYRCRERVIRQVTEKLNEETQKGGQ